MIVVDNICFSYNNKVDIFYNYSIEFSKGLTFLTGVNGIGKSTLLQLIMGILRPSSGNILIDNQDIKKLKLSTIGEKIGYLFQNPDLMLFGNTVYEELAFPLKLLNVDDTIIEEKVYNNLELFGLLGKEKDFPLTLSIGQRQRLALATIFMREPDKLLLDEPTSRLDYDMRQDLYKIIRNLIGLGKDIIIATHDMELINNFNGNVQEIIK